MFWKLIGKGALKVATYAIGHSDLIVQTVVDAKTKNVPLLIEDAIQIASTIKN